MAIKKLIKRFEFNDKNLPLVDLSGGLVVSLRSPRGLQLPRQQLDYGPSAKAKPYSLDQTLIARTWVTNPKGLRAWLGFQIERRQDPPSPDPEIEDTPVTIRFRLSDGTDDLWYDGAAWSVPVNPTDWNTESEVADNITTFPIEDRKLGIVISMFTIDERVTPRIQTAKFLYECDVNEQHDIVYSSLVPELKSLRCRSRVLMVMSQTGTSISFADPAALGFETEYEIVGVISAFDFTNDPNKLTDIAQSFDENTKELTLSSSVTQGDAVWIDFEFLPDVAVNTGRDFYEASKIPRIDVTNISFVDVLAAGSSTSSADSYFHPVTGDGFKIPGPREFDMFMVLEILGDKQYDVTHMTEAIAAWVGQSTELIMSATDERFFMISEGQVSDDGIPNPDDVRVYKMPLAIYRITSYDLPAEATAAPQSIVFEDGNLEFTVSQA